MAYVQTKEGDTVDICKGLVADRFFSKEKMENFFNHIDCTMSKQELDSLVSSLYKGYGKIDSTLIF
jgi:hypothetical protein